MSYLISIAAMTMTMMMIIPTPPSMAANGGPSSVTLHSEIKLYKCVFMHMFAHIPYMCM